MSDSVALEKEYRVRRVDPRKNCLEVTFPYQYALKEARARGMTVDEFLKSHNALMLTDDDGVHYMFKKDEDGR